MGTKKGLAEFQALKAEMGEQLLRKDYSGWSRAVINFRGDLCMASTGAISTNRDVDGRSLQDLHNLNATVQELLFGIVTTERDGAAVFVWRTGDGVPQAFVDSLLKKDNGILPGLIVQFAFAYIENTYFSKDWWESLSQNNREHLESLANISNAYYTRFEYSAAKIVPWEIMSVER